MRRRVAIASLALAWLCANGAIWDAVQVFAWGKMFATNTQTMPLAAALAETFDPAKKCDLCVTVAQAKEQAEQELPPTSQRDSAEVILVLHTPDAPIFGNSREQWKLDLKRVGGERADPVRLRPPRV